MAAVNFFLIRICSVGSSAPSSSHTWLKVLLSAAVLRAARMKTFRAILHTLTWELPRLRNVKSITFISLA